MKLLRYGPAGQEMPGLLDAQGRIRSLEGIVPDIAGRVLGPEGLDSLRRVDPASLPLVDEGVRLGPCVSGTGKFICIGLNYSDHAAETGATVPPEPIIFMKATSAICGPNDDVEIPRTSQKTDWEVELGVVIGRRAATRLCRAPLPRQGHGDRGGPGRVAAGVRRPRGGRDGARPRAVAQPLRGTGQPAPPRLRAARPRAGVAGALRPSSEERRVGKEGRSRWSAYH